jgi:hypothetical protein
VDADALAPSSPYHAEQFPPRRRTRRASMQRYGHFSGKLFGPDGLAAEFIAAF